MNESIINELIAEMVSAEETAAAARALVLEYMGENGIRSAISAGHKVTYVSAGYRTVYSDAMKADAAFIEAKAAYDNARSRFAERAERAAYISVKAI